MGFIEFLKNNFFHVLPLIVMATLGVAIIVERARALYRVYSISNFDTFIGKVADLVQQGKTEEAISFCEEFSSKPHAQVVKSGLSRAHLTDSAIEDGIQISLSETSQAVNKRTGYLSMIANVATLLGLFGTISGLIHSFSAVGTADASQKAALLANGISTAMNATMMGLGVAIPCMVAFSFLMNRTNSIVAELENAAIRTSDILKQRYFIEMDQE